MEANPIGDRLKDMREAAGLSPEDLAELAGLGSDAHVRMVEGGHRGSRMSAEVALRLSEALGCSVAYLIRGEDKRPADSTIKAAVRKAKRSPEAA